MSGNDGNFGIPQLCPPSFGLRLAPHPAQVDTGNYNVYRGVTAEARLTPLKLSADLRN